MSVETLYEKAFGAKLDSVVFNSKYGSVIDIPEYCYFMNSILCKPYQSTWRLRCFDDGSYELIDFDATIKEKFFTRQECLNRDSLPEWVSKKLSILELTDEGNRIEDIGEKISENVFYIIKDNQ